MTHDAAAKPKKILLELDPATAGIAATMAMQEGVSITKFSEGIVLAEVRRRLREGYVEAFTESFKESAKAVLTAEP